ncbi:uncharacterized protein BDZ99DRAFT_284149 [Mytilinidion resinicola]|uniref:2EXR domain-containing protein n=1 Tax=Mytilinidion resinicola TaxID=574789 RepID=A0A6A6YVK0_9PEZI|nr:uncharacterized protein BDZ99DRAFT_284149 [Mytilinidion resinicola]KAF2811947.1 hypothetical protein BDZ99DRAFT_284149 [Mytilinidion resinicola]
MSFLTSPRLQPPSFNLLTFRLITSSSDRQLLSPDPVPEVPVLSLLSALPLHLAPNAAPTSLASMESPTSALATRAAGSKADNSFTCFNYLPPEIRVHIWKLALPDRGRVIRLTQYQHPTEANAVPGSWPNVAMASREAFYETLNLLSTGLDERRNPRRLTYFNFERDVICIDSYVKQPECLPELMDERTHFRDPSILDQAVDAYAEQLKTWLRYHKQGLQVLFVVRAIFHKQVENIQKVLLKIQNPDHLFSQLYSLAVNTRFRKLKVIGMVLEERCSLYYLLHAIEEPELKRIVECTGLQFKVFMAEEEASFLFAYGGMASEYNTGQ